MRQPPPLTTDALLAYPVTVGLALLALLVTLAWWSGADVEPLFQDVRAFHGEPWCLLTATLLHVNLLHAG
jgi:membrane associated rhomboid family serine protease